METDGAAPLSVKLISMPWASPGYPSAQLGALQAWVEKTFPEIDCRSYSAFLEIPYRLVGLKIANLHDRLQPLEEFPFFLLMVRRYGPEPLARREEVFRKLLNEIQLEHGWLTEQFLNDLEAQTISFLANRVLASLRQEELTVIGFTLNFNQTYASLFAQRWLDSNSSRPDKLFFVYGGYPTVLNEFAGAAKHFSCDGLKVIGEGEVKIQKILTNLLRDGVPGDFGLDQGILPLKQELDLVRETKQLKGNQITDVGLLPIPNYQHFYEQVKALGSEDPLFERLLSKSLGQRLILEGSRGCFAACDFCGMNAQYKGFRSLKATMIFERVSGLIQTHGLKNIRFSDSVCDSWAEDFADLMIEHDIRIPMFMALRAHHPDSFWRKLSRAGVNEVQIGIEALSDPLLRAMGKGTRAIQNVSTLKSMRKYGIRLATSNIITHHPKSTLEDVQITRYLAKRISHLGTLSLSQFVLTPGSPLYWSLSEDDRSKLIPKHQFNVPDEYRHQIFSLGYHNSPGLELDPKIKEAWDQFQDWYWENVFANRSTNPQLQLEKHSFGYRVVDTRGRLSTVLLSHSEVELLRKLDHPVRRDTLTALEVPTMSALEENGLLANLGEHVISLVLLENVSEDREVFYFKGVRQKIKSIPLWQAFY